MLLSKQSNPINAYESDFLKQIQYVDRQLRRQSVERQIGVSFIIPVISLWKQGNLAIDKKMCR